MKRYRNIITVCTLWMMFGIITVYGDEHIENSDVKYQDHYIQSMNMGDKECYYCIFSSNENVQVDIKDITYKDNNVYGVQNYRLDDIPKLKEKDDNTYDRYNVEDNEYAFIKFRDISESDKKVYIYFAQMPLGVKQEKFIDEKYIVSIGNPTFDDFEYTNDDIKYKHYDGTYASGWTIIDNDTFYFDKSTNIAYKNQWLQDENNNEWYYFGEDALLVKGLQEIEGVKYWFSDSGKMLVNTVAPDGVTIDENGVYVEETSTEE